MSTGKEDDEKNKKFEWWKIVLIVLSIIIGLFAFVMTISWYFRGEKIKQKKDTGFFQPAGTKIPILTGQTYFYPNEKLYDLSS